MKQEQLESLIQSLLDGCIDPQDLQALETELASNPEAMSYYIAYTDLENLIQVQAEINAPQQTKVIPIDRIIRRQKRRSLRMAAISAAAIFLIALIAMRLFFVSEKEPLLTFEASPGTQFELSHSGIEDAPQGMTLEKGSRLQLSQGTVELTFASGVKSIIMAPADITLHEDDTLFMNRGTAWFQVPQQAIGFTVKTKDLDMVDLGTEFGVLAKPDDHDEIHVFKGKVQVTTTRLRKESAILTSNEARRIDPVGKLITINNKHTHFLTKLPKGLPYLHWSFDEISKGGFIAKNSSPTLASSTFAYPQNSLPSSLLVEGRFGKALRFTGNQGQEVITRYQGLSLNRPHTVACWVKIPHKTQSLTGFISWALPDASTKHGRWKFHHINGRLRLSCNGMTDGTTSIADNQWHHVAYVFSGKIHKNGLPDIQFYIDGNPEPISKSYADKSYAYTMASVFQKQPVTFAADLFRKGHPRQIFTGQLDEVFLIKGALNAKEVKTLKETNRYQPDLTH